MTGKPTRQPGAALPVRPLAARTAMQRTRPLDDQSQACSQEARTMTMLCNRSGADDGAPVIGRALAKPSRVRPGPGGNQAPNAVWVPDCPVRVLSSAGRETPGMRAGLRWPGGGS